MATNPETGNENRGTGTLLPTGNGQRATGNRQLRDLEYGADIAVRLLDLAAEVVRIIKVLPRDLSGRHVASQLVRAATAGGANYEEARGAESRADFIHKIGIAAKELRETIFWLRLVERSAMTTIAIKPLLSEATQLAAILAASARTARDNAKNSK